MNDELDISEEEEEAWLEEWRQADEGAAQVLAEAWPAVKDWQDPPAGLGKAAEGIRLGVAGKRDPYAYFVPDLASGEDDIGLWLDAATSTISPLDDPATDRGQSDEDASWIASLEHADWLALVVGLARRGVGAELTADGAFEDLNTMDEIEGELPEDSGAEEALTSAVEVLGPLWTAIGALDDNRRLTEVGIWGLPRALFLAWHDPEVPS